MSGSPTPRLIAGLAATLIMVSVVSIYTLRQIEGLRALQTNTVERNRKDSLQLLRIQNDLNSLGLAIRDILEAQQDYPLTAFGSEFTRLRNDLDDALSKEAVLASRPREQNEYLQQSLRQFWTSIDEVLGIAQNEEARARRILSNSITAQQASLSSTVSRLLVQNHEAEEQANAAVQQIYDRVERNIYMFLIAILTTIAAIGMFVAVSNRRVFQRLEQVSEQRSTLSRRLIGLQEEIFRSVSRELHDDFGQVLTAVGLMLARAEKKGLPTDSSFREELTEVRQVVQDALEKTRSFSQALHPTILDDYGLEKAIERYLLTVERQSGIPVHFEKRGSGHISAGHAIHVYRILQEALNNVIKHAKANKVRVQLSYNPKEFLLQVEDDGAGISEEPHGGLGLIAMRERAQMVGGSLEISGRPNHGTAVTLKGPTEEVDL